MIIEYEQVPIPGCEENKPIKRTYRFHMYYRYSYIGYTDIVTNCITEEKAYKQAWAILYKTRPEIKHKDYKVTDVYQIA